jgi:hypothetical protein
MRYYFHHSDSIICENSLSLGKFNLFTWLISCFSFAFFCQELVALEEQIGSVSTALSEEQFAKCVDRNIYEARNPELELNNIQLDDVRCSICQVYF